MEDRKLDEAESLALIANMIKDARTNLRAKINCNKLLVVGYVSVVVSMAVWALKTTVAFQWSSLVWFLVPAICYPVSRYLSAEDKTNIKSYLDRIIDYISGLIAILCSTIPLLTVWVEFPVFFVESLLIGIWLAIIGLLIKYRPVIWGGIAGIIIAYGLLFVPSVWQIPAFSTIFVFSIIIPGHLFKSSVSKNV
jgi:hypothetical protein